MKQRPRIYYTEKQKALMRDRWLARANIIGRPEYGKAPVIMLRSSNTMILEATHTHLYPGHSGKISGLTQIADLKKDLDCLVAFADGSAASAVLSRTENGWQLYTKAYRTAAGTDVGEKLWFVRLQEDGAEVKFRILNKAQIN